KKEKEKRDKDEGGKGFFSLFSSRNSTSFSESTRSSNDSLSSDTKSKVTQITVVKVDRSESPPLEIAPSLPRHESTATLVNRSPSRESVVSDKTPTREPTPPPLPKRTYKKKENSSGSSHGSPVGQQKTFDYCEIYQTTRRAGSAHELAEDYMVIDTEGTLAIKNANQSGLNREL
ncbi:hypothetical protein PFISCL1PPCAC_27336, partial [Pristionchus fissidentatus]